MSYWLETAGDLSPRPALDGSTRADVAILGAGYTGLWTAYELLRREPSLDIVILEKDIAGYGASGRNGGWCTSDSGASLSLLTRRFGRDSARRAQLAMYGAVDEVGRVAAAEGIDAAFRKGGKLSVARGAAQLPALREAHEEQLHAGFRDRCTVLDAAELSERVRIHGAVAALFSLDCAVIHPGRLVRGLADVVVRRGARLYERTPITQWEGGAHPVLRTTTGEVRASTIVLAAEAYLSQLPSLRRAVLPVYSLIVLTEPVDDDRWNAVGWEGHECISSMRLTVDYLSRTDDARIVVGGRGAPYRFGSTMDETLAHHAATHASLRQMLPAWFPSLGDVGFSHAWGGAVAIPRDFIPQIRHDRRSGVAMAYGYTGHGVAFAQLAGQTLAELILEEQSELTSLPFVGHVSRRWEPEPLRWVGVRAAQAGLARVDARQGRKRPPRRRSLAERLVNR
ncbi:MAG: FAD-dependent oxidoreductase [Candidatus Dormibacteraeota bacterium]|nr:FAD-dependent oxidoreductase [Candidatus Dormibacteraeota bacterium]